MLSERLDWLSWEGLIDSNGITIDRPARSVHPKHPDIVYPIDYGFINGTQGSDGEEVDVFVGSSTDGLVGAIQTVDYRKGDREIKFLYACTGREIYVVNGFINYDRTLMEGWLILRRPFEEINLF